MFWDSDFTSSTSAIDVLLQQSDVKLTDILFEDELLSELKLSNINVSNFLVKPEMINELLENITQLAEEDCCDKILYSRVHAAYISCEILTAGSSEIFTALMDHPDSLNKIITCLTTMANVVPQKATLVSKLINNIHSNAPEKLSCHITQDIDTFSKLINTLIQNIDISGSCEILYTLINRTSPSSVRFVFCEVLSKMNFVNSLIDVMTTSSVEDKQRNACQILCDIIVIGRQECSEQSKSEIGPVVQDMLAEQLESKDAVKQMLTQIFSEENKNKPNTTAIICGIKVLQTLVEDKQAPKDIHSDHSKSSSIARVIEQIEEEIEEHLINFHELLLNPPKQEPIKTTFGVIQKPLGYIRLEVVNLIRALLGTNSPRIIKKLVELRTMKVVIDLFVDYSWNNLLHTQVEQALCLIIKNCRAEEDREEQNELPSKALLSQTLNEGDLVSKLLLPNRNGESNFGHIIQIINSLAINNDLDAIRDHLNEMKDKRPELFERWTTFVSVDVASFKKISLFYDIQSNVNVDDRFCQKHQYFSYLTTNDHHNNTTLNQTSTEKITSNSTLSTPTTTTTTTSTADKNNGTSNNNTNGDDPLVAYYTFARETILPSINVDVLPKIRKQIKSNQIKSNECSY